VGIVLFMKDKYIVTVDHDLSYNSLLETPHMATPKRGYDRVPFYSYSYFPPQTKQEIDTKIQMSRNRPNYKNKSTKIIAGAIKFPYLSSYNSGSPIKSRGISNQPTYKPRS
jgi:hypothetical protein